ncbi:hypothetical protein DUE52_24270 [Larkinella punicea]|uniref:Uncharacterized protein n=2 Tax=Larkinella punicea TaxID=2315727 RepID=A0A368JGY0_9BACT|nr:hypothetical protein DUE52_24270 [Larkinella punicea]
MTATSAAVLPAFLASCSDHKIPPGVGAGDPEEAPLTNFELYSAAQNLLHMNAWVEDVYLYTGNYEQYVLAILKSGEKPTEWKDFIIDILTEIATGILEVAAGEIPGAGPAIAIVSDIIKKWTTGDKPANLDAEFAEFKLGHLQMQIAISNTLLKLADETDDYKNLREGFGKDVELNGKTYSLRDLATSQFPTVKQGDEYTALRTAAYDRFRKYIWNVMIMKAGKMTYSALWSRSNESYDSPTQYARDVHYSDGRYKSTYLRGWYDWFGNLFYYRYFYFEFDGRELSSEAAKELFKDDTPEHIINPDGLFTRDYVFKQFHKEQPDWFGYHELRKDLLKTKGFTSGDKSFGFDPAADHADLTGGDFPLLIKR